MASAIMIAIILLPSIIMAFPLCSPTQLSVSPLMNSFTGCLRIPHYHNGCELSIVALCSTKKSSNVIDSTTTNPKATNLQTKTPTTGATTISTTTSTDDNNTQRPKKRFSWNERFDQLCEFYNIHNHCRVPLDYEPNPGLGTWVRNQRTHYRNLQKNGGGKYPSLRLKPERYEALASLGFDWWHDMREKKMEVSI